MNKKTFAISKVIPFLLVGALLSSCDVADASTSENSSENSIEYHGRCSYIVKVDRHNDSFGIIYDSDYETLKEEFYQPFSSSYSETTEPVINNFGTSLDSIDSNNNDYSYFSKVTFNLENRLSEAINYQFEVTISSPVEHNSIVDLIRIRIYENFESEPAEHAFKTYAKESVNGEPERISNSTSDYAEMFVSDTKVFDGTTTLESNKSLRYTLVTWIEGEDPQAWGKNSYISDNFIINVAINEK